MIFTKNHTAMIPEIQRPMYGMHVMRVGFFSPLNKAGVLSY